jgi:hypothetical protein
MDSESSRAEKLRSPTTPENFSMSLFEAIGDLADQIVAQGGLTVSDFTDDGGFYVHIPLIPETTPDIPA